MNWETFGSLASAFFSAAAFALAVWLALKRIPDELEKLRITRREEQRAAIAEQLWVDAALVFAECQRLFLRRLLPQLGSKEQLAHIFEATRTRYAALMESQRRSSAIADIWLSDFPEVHRSSVAFMDASSAIMEQGAQFVSDCLADEGSRMIPDVSGVNSPLMGDPPWLELLRTFGELRAAIIPIARHELPRPALPPATPV